MHAFITSRLDYYNALLSGLPKKAIGRLQLVKNVAAQRTHMKPVLKSLCWLPISLRIDFKIVLLVFKSLNGNLILLTCFIDVHPAGSLDPQQLASSLYLCIYASVCFSLI